MTGNIDDQIRKLIRRASRASGVGEVRLCYFGGLASGFGGDFHARAMPDSGRLAQMAEAALRESGRPSISITDHAEAIRALANQPFASGKGETPVAALEALLAIIEDRPAKAPPRARAATRAGGEG